MAEKSWIQEVVERVVSQVLDSHMPPLREDIIRRVLAELQPALGVSPEANPTSLLKAMTAVQHGSAQREVLRALLDHAARYCGRVALFVIRPGAVNGWQGRGFEDNEKLKDFALDANGPLISRVLAEHAPVQGSPDQMDAGFMSTFGGPASGEIILLPLMLKERVSAVIYADAGQASDGKLESAALEILVLSTSSWLEVLSLRKSVAGPIQAQVAEVGVREVEHAEAPRPPAAAVHAEVHSTVSMPSAEKNIAEPEPAEAIAIAAAASASAESVSGVSHEDAEVHRKAQRFAKLLVDEIKLYNLAKVEEGRKNRDLYHRLKEDIEKSRATYARRYGSTPAAAGNYFDNELIRSLAQDDPSVLGTGFRR
jgi:hypothetical protein